MRDRSLKLFDIVPGNICILGTFCSSHGSSNSFIEKCSSFDHLRIIRDVEDFSFLAEIRLSDTEFSIEFRKITFDEWSVTSFFNGLPLRMLIPDFLNFLFKLSHINFKSIQLSIALFIVRDGCLKFLDLIP